MREGQVETKAHEAHALPRWSPILGISQKQGRTPPFGGGETQKPQKIVIHNWQKPKRIKKAT